MHFSFTLQRYTRKNPFTFYDNVVNIPSNIIFNTILTRNTTTIVTFFWYARNDWNQICRWYADVWSHGGLYPVHPPIPSPWSLEGHNQSHVWSIHIPFVLSQSILQFLRLGHFKLWHWKCMRMIKGQGLSIQFIWYLFISYQSEQQVLTYSYFKI